MRTPRRTSSLAETAWSPRTFEFTVHGVELAVTTGPTRPRPGPGC
jgi:hypothetical protein